MSAIPAELAKLSLAERIQLVEDLWDNIAAEAPEAIPLTEAQRAELRRRWQAHRDDPSSGVPWEDVRSGLMGSGA